jgi:hypothetical protein
MSTLFYEPKNPGRIVCEKHVSASAGQKDKLPAEDLVVTYGWVDGVWHDDLSTPARCADCGVVDNRIALKAVL